MRDDLVDLLEKADLAIGSCAGVIDGDDLAPLIAAVRAVRARLSYPEETLVVALAGGTGSGKSSLFNALVGEELADVGGIRPTTTRPMAALPSSAGSTMDGYLDLLGVVDRHETSVAGVCLIDLPDTDSVEPGHRHRVDALLPLVDVVVWVVDPQKYRDSRLHDEYLKPLAAYSAQLVFALNQTDRLSETDVEEIMTDLEAALEEDWLDEAVMVAVAASPPAGPPEGLDELRRVLEIKVTDRSTLYRKLVTDLAVTSRELSDGAGTGLDFDARAADALLRATRALVDGEPSAAIDSLTGLLDDLARQAGASSGSKLTALAAEVPLHVRRIEDTLVSAHDPPPSRLARWLRRRRRDAPATDPQAVRTALSEAVIRPARAVLARRALAVASVAELAVATEELRSRLPR